MNPTFEIGKLTGDKTAYAKKDVVKVKFIIKNTGSKYSAEVAQLYVSQVTSSVLRRKI